jgi:trehalose 6-phosphate phosphatase
VDPLDSLRAAPERAAILLDVDGTLAPIVERPEDARVPDDTRSVLRGLVARYGLVAAVTGRPSALAREFVGVEEIEVAGLHGLELEPEAEAWRDRVQAFTRSVDWPVENKGLSVSFHYRTHEDPARARAELERVAERARNEGLKTRFGRMVLEVLPPVDASKATAVRHLLDHAGLSRALYAGDDSTDLDAFAALAQLEVGVRVAVRSTEAPKELLEQADVVVDDTSALVTLLRTL